MAYNRKAVQCCLGENRIERLLVFSGAFLSSAGSLASPRTRGYAFTHYFDITTSIDEAERMLNFMCSRCAIEDEFDHRLQLNCLSQICFEILEWYELASVLLIISVAT